MATYKTYTRKFKPAAYVPTISHGGDEEPIIFRGENMWIRSSRAGFPYAEGYTGNQDLSETIATKTLTGTIAWDSTTYVVTGTGTAFLSEIRLGCFVLGDGGAGLTELFVVEKVTSNTLFTCSKKPTATATGKTGYVLPVIFPVGTDRGTCIRGNVLQFPQGSYLGVGDGTVRINGSTIAAAGKTFLDANVTVGTENIAIALHGFSPNQAVTLSNSGGALPTGLSTNTIYYVLVVDANNIKLSTSAGGSPVNITAAAGGGTHTVTTGIGTGGTFGLSTLPQFALYDAVTNTYTQDDVGIDKPTTPITVAAITTTSLATPTVAITSSTDATPIVVTSTTAHGLYNGQTGVYITGHLVNTNANGMWTITKLTDTTFSLNSSIATGAGAGGATGTIAGSASPMQPGDYSIRVCAKNTKTLGFSQPSDVVAPVNLTGGQAIKITFNAAMVSDQDAYDIYATAFEDNATTTIVGKYMGPWFLVRTVKASELIDATHTTGRETGTSYIFAFADAEIQTATQILTFNNFAPVDAEFVDLINGIPIYFSCQGKGTVAKTAGTSPGPAAIPSKPSNPEAVFLNKTITTAGGDYILGEFNAKSRIFALCQNSLQTLLLTTLEEEPITFRSLWNTGFRNPYNVAFVKEYLYGDSTQGIVRSVAGGDDSAMEFEFASDMRDIFAGEPCGHKLVAYDPKNKAVCFFYAAAERRSGYWVTLVRPFMVEKGIWNPPIVLKKTNQDFIVSGVATIGNQLVFTAGGRTSGAAITMGTYVFDGGDSETKDWYLAWNYADDGAEFNPKTVKGFVATGKFASASTAFKVYGLRQQGAQATFDTASLMDGTNYSATYTIAGTGGYLARKRFRFGDWGPYPLYTVRMEGAYTTTADRFDEVAVQLTSNNSEI